MSQLNKHSLLAALGLGLAMQAVTQEAEAGAPAVTEPVIPNFDATVNVNDYSFHFKKDKETEVKRPTVELKLPTPSLQGIANILTSGDAKQQQLLLEAVASVVLGQARGIINDTLDIKQDNFPYDKISWKFIAELPPAERRGGGISKETWEAFAVDYMAVMKQHTQKTEEQLQNAVKLFVARLQPCRTNKPALRKLSDQLDVWYTNSTNQDDLKEVYDFLHDKCDKFINISDEELANNL